MSVLIDLFKALTTELATQLTPVVVERRYMPRVDAGDLASLKVSVYLSGTEREEIARGVVNMERHTFGIAVQQAVSEQVATDTAGHAVLDGIDNLVSGDAVINQMETIKSLWRASGAMRDKLLANCRFLEMVHEPPYESIHLITMGVYTSILDVTYQTT